MLDTLPYKIAVLCYLFDENDRLLLLHRKKPPNQDLFSPIGGKLEQSLGESPTACAVREIQEETGLTIETQHLHLTGIVSEKAYENQTHWLMFLYEVTKPVTLNSTVMDEGILVWKAPQELSGLAIPATDRHIIWPLFWRYRRRFFAAHIDCGGESLKCRIEQPSGDAGNWLV